MSEIATQLSSGDARLLSEINRQLAGQTPQQRIDWAIEHIPGQHLLSSSFGIQAAVLLHMLTDKLPTIPVVLIDTGYLFAETYQFIDQLTERLNLNLQIYRNPISPAWQEARFGKLWEQGIDGIDQYNAMNKVQPMDLALEQHQASVWYAGLRRSQSSTRSNLQVLDRIKGRFKLLPIIDWSNKQIHEYLQQHNLPYHPLWEKGYVSVGDHHTSMPLQPGMTEEQTRFFGLKRECGLHESNIDGDGI